MTGDVYAGDDSLTGPLAEIVSASPTVIRMRAESHPDVVLRIACHLNLLNRASLRLAFEQAPNGEVGIEVTLDGRSEFMSDLQCRKLEQLTCMLDVA